MRIATWNIGGGFIFSKQKMKFDLEKIGYFIDELRKIKPEIVCFQEIHVSKNNNQPEIIAKALGFKFIKTKSIADSHVKNGEKLSISVISKFPIISSKFNKLPNPNLYFIWKGKRVRCHDKGFLEVKINYKGRVVRVLSGHMVPFRKFGRDFLDDEFKNIRDKMEKIICRGKNPEIVCGDMNFENIHKLLPNVFKRGFSFILKNSPTSPKGRRYDKIIISKDWKAVNSKIIPGKADHYLCFAEMKLKN